MLSGTGGLRYFPSTFSRFESSASVQINFFLCSVLSRATDTACAFRGARCDEAHGFALLKVQLSARRFRIFPRAIALNGFSLVDLPESSDGTLG